MTTVRNLFFLLSITIFAIATLVLTIFNYDPNMADGSIFTQFYISLLISLTGIIALIILFLRYRFSKNNLFLKNFWPAIRQGFFVAAALTLLLFLLGLKVLDSFVGISFLIVIILLELFFQTKKN